MYWKSYTVDQIQLYLELYIYMISVKNKNQTNKPEIKI